MITKVKLTGCLHHFGHDRLCIYLFVTVVVFVVAVVVDDDDDNDDLDDDDDDVVIAYIVALATVVVIIISFSICLSHSYFMTSNTQEKSSLLKTCTPPLRKIVKGCSILQPYLLNPAGHRIGHQQAQ